MTTRIAHGVKYERRTNLGDSSRFVWEGGPRGGTIFERNNGTFGNSKHWHDKFDDAAFVNIQSNQERADRLRNQLYKYDSQLMYHADGSIDLGGGFKKS